MTDNLNSNSESQERQEVDKAELSAVIDLMQTLVKTSKAFKMYLSNNPLLQRFQTELNSKMAKQLNDYGEMRLDIDQYELKYKGNMVYENKDPKDSFAFRMYSDGMRSLILSEGIEEREINDFLDIVGKERAGEIDDDIVTLLWMKDLPHITYILAEDYLEFETAGFGAASTEPQKERVRSLHNTLPPPEETPPAPMMIPQSILLLSEDEISEIRKAKETDEKRSPFQEIVNVLTAILSVERDVNIFSEYVDITVGMVSTLAKSGNFKRSIGLLRFLKGLAVWEHLPEPQKIYLTKALDGIMPGLVKDIEGIIDTSEDIGPELFRELLSFLDKSFIHQLCELLGKVERVEIRKVLVDALVQIGKDSPEMFYSHLSDERWYLVRNAILILRRIGNPSSLDQVAKLVSHGEPRVRKEILIYLESPSTDRGNSLVTKFINDPTPQLRLQALKILGTNRYKGALKQLIDLSGAKEFEDREISEKKAFFEAIGEIGSEEVLPIFRELLNKKYWFNKSKEREDVMCAISGLRKIRSKAVITLLEESASQKKDEIRPMVTQAAKTIRAELEKAQG